MLTRNRPWTAEDDDQLLKLRLERRSWMRIAANLRRTVSAVKSRAYLLQEREKPLRSETA